MPAVKQAKLPENPRPNERDHPGRPTPNGSSGRNGSPLRPPRNRPKPGSLTRLWRTIKAVYYASKPIWQLLKSGTLLFFGFFCWSSANLLLSYQPDWHWTYFLMAYGFLLTGWGPLTHLVLVPHVIPWLRRFKRGSTRHWLGKQLTPINLTIFFAAVLWMGIFPPDAMTVDFRAIVQETRTVDVNPTLECTQAPYTVTCRVENADGVGSITVESGDNQLLKRDAGNLTFTVRTNELVEIVGQRQFQVTVYTPEGEPVRHFTRTVSMIR